MSPNNNNSLGLFLAYFSQYFATGDSGIAIALKKFQIGIGFDDIAQPFDVHLLLQEGFKFEPGLSIPVFSNHRLNLDEIAYKTKLVMDVSEALINPGRIHIFTSPLWGLVENFFKVADEMKKMPIYSLGLNRDSGKAKILGIKTRNPERLASFAQEELQRINHSGNIRPHQLFVIWRLVRLDNGKEQTWVRLKDSEVDRLLTIK